MNQEGGWNIPGHGIRRVKDGENRPDFIGNLVIAQRNPRYRHKSWHLDQSASSRIAAAGSRHIFDHWIVANFQILKS